MKLNKTQYDLLHLVKTCASQGCVAYGRAYAETANALAKRGLIASIRTQAVASHGSIEFRPVWAITADGERALVMEPSHG